MIPIYLEIQGLNSYQEPQRIDFSNLTKGQLFGIFGPVGSGKSTLLDAITLALYGEMERLGKHDNRNYNLLNLRSQALHIDFRFLAGHPQKQFRFTVKAIRDKKQFEKVPTLDRSAYEWIDQKEWKPIDPGSVESILGLSYANFRRTVILPQGQFQEFLQLGVKDRSQMLKEIFGLEKYDLFDKSSQIEKKYLSKKEQMEGQLTQLLDINAENLQLKKQRLAEVVDLATARQQWILQLESIEKNAKSFLDALTAWQQKKEEHEKAMNSLALQEKRMEERRQAYEIALQKAGHADTVKAYIEVLHHWLELKNRELEKKLLENRLKNGQALLLEKLSAITHAQDQMQAVQHKIQAAEQAMPDLNVLYPLLEQYREINKLKKQLLELQNEIHDANLQEQDLGTQLKAEWSAQQIQAKRENLLKDQQHWQEVEKDLLVHLKVKDLANSLQEGKPCPLCGATHHPNKWNPADSSEKLEEVERQIRNVQQQLDQLVQQEKQSAVLLTQHKSLLEKLATLRLRQQTLALEVEELNKNIPAAAPSPASVEEWIATAQSLQEQLKQDKTAAQAWQQQWQKSLADRDKYQEGLNQLQEQLIKVNQHIEFSHQSISKKGKLKLLDEQSFFQNFDPSTASEVQLKEGIGHLENELKNLETHLEITRKDYEQSLSLCNQWRGSAQLLLQQTANVEMTKLACEATYNLVVETIPQSQAMELETNLPLPVFYEKLRTRMLHDANVLQEHNSQRIQLENDIQRIESKWHQKQTLEEQSLNLKERLENLRVIRNLLKGAGFIDFIATYFLKELCEQANERFAALTRQQLQLELNDKNQFVVRDFLNEGKVRSVKTLSGGQIFQASLSLALALAENVGRQHHAEQQFFFIDEGFGSQDQDSLDLILQTLRSLRKENRIVGIISHVDRLKQELDVYLNIHVDEARGSLISIN